MLRQSFWIIISGRMLSSISKYARAPVHFLVNAELSQIYNPRAPWVMRSITSIHA
jgi:hypothetical protein